jgi:hypothetical protein
LSAGSIKEKIISYRAAITLAETESRKGDAYDYQQILQKLLKE